VEELRKELEGNPFSKGREAERERERKGRGTGNGTTGGAFGK